DSPLSSQNLKSPNNSPLCSQFLSIPSSTSMLSSDQPVSDLSGQSPIESSNLRTSVSEPSRTADIIEEETTDETNFNVLKQKQ
ncbi:unnamed protein product, partial [Rotaria magnacalcarata]